MGAQSYSESVPPSTSPTSSTVDPVSLSNFLQRQADQHAESANAFHQNTTEEPSIRNLLDEIVKLQRQVLRIKNRLVRLQQGLLICQFLSVLVAGSLVALVSFFYFQPRNASQLLGIRDGRGPSQELILEYDQLESQWPESTSKEAEDQVTASHRTMIFEFVQRADRVKRKVMDTQSTRQTKQEIYIELLGDLTLAAEDLTSQHACQETCEMLIKVANFAKQNHSYGQPSRELLQLRKEITKFCELSSRDLIGAPQR